MELARDFGGITPSRLEELIGYQLLSQTDWPCGIRLAGKPAPPWDDHSSAC